MLLVSSVENCTYNQ